MLAIALILGLVSVGLLGRAVFKLAVHALPFFVAVTVGMTVLNAGLGVAILAGITAAVFTLMIGRALFASSTSLLLRGLVAAAFLIPAAMAGRQVAFGAAALIAELSPFWREIIGWSGALLVAGYALQQLLHNDLSRRLQSTQDGDQSLHSSRL
ncbi:hypothetical protein [Bradyrhizobium sp. STM 3809]|uniref:hypothetical protein n=1 Tax=Bradyrhizobium sp. STM 3809 TaxID=551936 RepID=UPI0002408257|nr:hypothetical protein [Bradyrhizobium sp. STM 3809]CCE03413.1 conserved membrane hypothetical protein [Bradyrhizobium sp. STM 3809]